MNHAAVDMRGQAFVGTRFQFSGVGAELLDQLKSEELSDFSARWLCRSDSHQRRGKAPISDRKSVV